jgi:hypothetical protein
VAEEAACHGVVEDLRLRHVSTFLVLLLYPQNLLHVKKVLRLGLGFWSFVDWELMLALLTGSLESDGLRIQRKGWPLLSNLMASS